MAVAAMRPETTALATRVNTATRSHAVPMLQVFAIAAMAIPSDAVVHAIGGAGYAAALIGYALILGWAAAVLFGLHDALARRSPVRISLCALWIVSLLSYALMNRATLSATDQTGADRWLLQLAGVSGVILVASECLTSIEDIRRVFRALTWGGAFCGVVAALQFSLKFDLAQYLGRLPGFSPNQADSVYSFIGSRGGLNRVSGTAIDPIELGVVAGMLLPLAVYLAIHDLKRPAWQRWLPVICIAIAIPVSVSRSAVLSAAMGLGVLIACLPPVRRLLGVGATVFGVLAIFVAAPSLLGTLKTYFLAGTSDSSIAHRVNEYPFVEEMVRQAPWFGQGGGTYIVTEVHILDNEYLTTAIELGLVGAVALVFYLLWPALAALVARRRATDPELRDLCAALAGSELAAVLCSATFDSLSFPMFVSVQALVVGLTGAAWLLSEQENNAASEAQLLAERIEVAMGGHQSAAHEDVTHLGVL
jgi:O-antigen ligase